MTDPLRALTARIKSLESRLDQLARSPQLSRSSIENGAVQVYDHAGQLTAVVGRQYDGTHGAVTVAGPTPPTPAGVGGYTVTSGARLSWDGTFVQTQTDRVAGRPTVAPLDFTRVELQVADNPDFTGAPRGGLYIGSAAGGEVFVPWSPAGVLVYARARTWSAAGKFSPWSLTAGPFEVGKIGVADLGFDIGELGGTTVHYGPDDPQDDPETVVAFGDLWMAEVDPGPPPTYQTYRWIPAQGAAPDRWALLADQGATDALAAAVAAQQAADAKATVHHEPAPPAWEGPAGSAVWFDTSEGNRAHRWDGDDWEPIRLGSGAIAPSSLVASDVIATGTITGTLLEAVMVLATAVIGGDPEGAHASLSEEGLRLYAVNPEGMVQQTGGFGTGDDGVTLNDPTTGDTTVSISGVGGGVMQSLAVAGLDADGDGMPDSGMAVYGREWLDWLDDRAEGAISSAFLGQAGGGIFASNITTRFGLGEVSFLAKAARNYLVIFDGLHFSANTTPLRGLISVRSTSDGSTPTITNGTVHASKFFNLPSNAQAYSAPAVVFMGAWSQTQDRMVRLLATVERMNGSSTITAHTYSPSDPWSAPFRFFVLDVGRDIEDTYIPNDGGGVRPGGNPQPNPRATYTSAWTASFVGSYLGNGSRRTDTTDLLQGYTPYYPAGGTQRALAGFMGGATQGEVGRTMAQALAGASISRVEIALHCNHSHATAGGTARIGYHGNTTVPSSSPNSQWEGFGSAFFARGQTRWMALPASTHGAWLSGAYRGITVGPGGDYMRFDGMAGTRPAIRITYTR